MTAQITDAVVYQGKTYRLAGENGTGLFDPKAYGLTPRSTTSANWRGFWCEYAVVGGQLELTALTIGLERRVPIFGVEPGTSPFGGLSYKGLHRPIAYTGGLLLGEGFIDALYVHMGFHPAYKYRVVHELIFEAGRVVRVADQSAAMKKIRERLKGKPLKPGAGASHEELTKWIAGTFSRKY